MKGRAVRLIDVREILGPDEELLDRLQILDPMLDLFYVGKGEWWLGRVKPNSERRQVGLRMMANLERVWGRGTTQWPVLVPINRWERWKQDHLPRWLLALWPVRCERLMIGSRELLCPLEDEYKPRLMIQGFGLVERVLWPEIPDGRLVNRFRETYWLLRHTPMNDIERAVFAATRGEAKKEVQRARIKDYMETEARWLYNRIVKHRALVSVH